jgi:hypothetical protein
MKTCGQALHYGLKPCRVDACGGYAAAAGPEHAECVRDLNRHGAANDRAQLEVVFRSDFVELGAHGGVQELNALVAAGQSTAGSFRASACAGRSC